MKADVQQLVNQYLDEGIMMVVASVAGDQPWVCTVYFVADENRNIYWVSTPERRHSQEIAQHNKVAAAIPLDANPGEPNVGMQLQGTAQQVISPEEIEFAINLYAVKFSSGQDYIDDFLSGKDEHKLYKITPSLFVLFDEKNFPENTRQELKV